MSPRAHPDLYTALSDVSRKLDEMLAELSSGVRSQAHFNQLEEQASDLGAQLRAVFRNGKVR